MHNLTYFIIIATNKNLINMYWILGIIIVIVLFYYLILKPVNKQMEIEINKHREYTEKNKLDVSKFIKTGKYVVGFPQANKVINQTSLYTNNENLILYHTKYSNYALEISSIEVKKIQNIYIDNFHSMNDRIIVNNILFNESYFVSLSQVEQNMPYYMVIEWGNKILLHHAVFIFEGKDALLFANRAVHELSEHINLEFSCGF